MGRKVDDTELCGETAERREKGEVGGCRTMGSWEGRRGRAGKRWDRGRHCEETEAVERGWYGKGGC